MILEDETSEVLSTEAARRPTGRCRGCWLPPCSGQPLRIRSAGGGEGMKVRRQSQLTSPI